MAFALLAWLVLLYLLSSKPGWFGCLLVLVDIFVIQPGQNVPLVTSPRPSAQPCHQKLLRTVPASKCATGVVTVGQRSAGL